MPLGVVTENDVAGAEWTPPTRRSQRNAERIVGRDRQRGTAIADAAGVIVLNLGAPPFGLFWLVDRIAVRCNAAVATEARIYTGAIADTNEEDATPSGNSDVSEYPRGLYVPGAADLIVEWTGAAAGDVGYATAQLAVVSQD